jgi:hypothetical protein
MEEVEVRVATRRRVFEEFLRCDTHYLPDVGVLVLLL